MVRLNRPEKRNAISDEIILSLEEVFSSVPSGVKCAVLSGTGQHFSAGLDLQALSEKDVVEGVHHSRMWHRVLDKIQFGTVPVVAVLQGACVGGGLELACACHIRIAESGTFYALPEGQRGIFVGGGASVRLPKLIGTARVTDMMLTGRVVSAEEGLAIGMSQYVVPAGTGLDKGLELAKKISSNASMTNYALMHVLPRIADAAHDQASMTESLMAAIAQNTNEAKERMRSFLEGRSKKVGE
jgi:enoyl-CoA hydratase/carnithine racemase